MTPVEDSPTHDPARHGRDTHPRPAGLVLQARRISAEDELTCDPWRCFVEHQPLGFIQEVHHPVHGGSGDFSTTTNA